MNPLEPAQSIDADASELTYSMIVPQDHTLWSIATQYIETQEHLTMNDIPKVVETIVKDNPEAFVNGDKDQLKAGTTLKLPRDFSKAPEDSVSLEVETKRVAVEQTMAEAADTDAVREAVEPAVEKAEEAANEAENKAVNKTEQAAEAEGETGTEDSSQAPEMAEGVTSDVVAQGEQVASESSTTTEDADNDGQVEEVEEAGFFARNWLWLGALGAGGVALATKSDDEPVPDPTLSLSDNQVNATEASFTVSGTADKNASVVVTVGNFSKTVSSDEQGNYSATFTAEDIAQAGQGSLSVSVASNRNGGRVSETTTATIDIDTVAPDAPVTLTITDDNVVNAAEVTAQITGTAEAGSTLAISIGSNTRTVIAAEDGNWLYALTAEDIAALGEGNVTLSLTATDSFGNVSDTATFAFSIDTLSPNAPSFAAISTDDLIGSAETTPTVSGTAEAGAAVALTIGAVVVDLTADTTGAWSYTLTAADLAQLNEGANTLSAAATDAAGNTSSPGTTTLTLDTTAPSAPVINDATADNVISTGEVNADITGRAEANATVTLTIAGDVKTVTADADGNWRYTLTNADVTAMAEGSETLSAVQTDVAGNTGVAGTKEISVDTIAPNIQSMDVDAASNTITLTYNDTIDAVNLPTADNFVVSVGNVANTVDNVSVIGNQVTLTLASAFASGQAVVIKYVDASGDQSNAIQDIAGNDVSGFSTGVVADGFVRDAQIYLDANGDGIAQADELLEGVATDALGNFILPEGANPDNHAIIAVGGVNIDTGAPNKVPLKAPAGASVINPITTLVQTALENDLAADVGAAQSLVKTALGISDAGIDLLAYEPISAIAAGGDDAAAALSVQKTAVQIAAVVAQANEGKDAEGTQSDANTILTNIVTQASEGNTVDFTDSDFVTAALGTVTATVAAADIVSAATAIDNSADLATLIVAQAEAIDNVAPAAPTSVSATALTKETSADVTVAFDTQAIDGSAVVVGDTVTVTATLGDNEVSATHVLTAADISAGEAVISVSGLVEGNNDIVATITDIAQNTGSTASAATPVTVDLTLPSVTLSVDDAQVNSTETATVTLTFDEDPGKSISVDDLTVTGGLITQITGTGLVRTAEFTPLSDTDQAASVAVTGESYTDPAGNAGAGSSVEFAVDTKLPTVAITSDSAALKAGETAVITFTFSEAPGTSFALSDITVANGTLADLTGEGTVYTATLTPAVDTEGAVSITVNADSYTDAFGNLGTAGQTPNVAIDTLLPILTLTEASTDENSTAVATLTTSESSTISLGEGADTALFTLIDGVLSFTTAPDFETDAASYTVNVVITDAAGNANTGALTITLNNLNEAPTATPITAQTAVLDQAFSYDVTSFFADQDASDSLSFSITEGTLPAGLSLVNGVISGSPTATTEAINATITATDSAGLSVSQPVSINVVAAPVVNTINLADNLVKAGDAMSIVLSLSEAFTLTLNDAAPTITLLFGETSVTGTYASHDGTAGTVTFSATAPAGDVTGFSLSAIDLGEATLVGNLSAQPLVQSATGQQDSDTVLDNTAATVTTETLSAAENSTAVGTLETSETATVTLGEGADSALFSLDNGVLSLNAAQDFETDETELTVNLDVVDTAGNTSTDTVTVNITDVNEAPTASTIAAQTAVVGRAFSLDVSEFFADVDANDTLSYTITGDLPDGLSLVDGVLSGTATADAAAANITVTATDSSGLSASQTFAVTAVSAPVFASIAVSNSDNSDNANLARAGQSLTVVLSASEAFTLTGEATDTIAPVFSFGSTDVTGTYVSHDATTGTMTFSVVAPDADASSVTLKSIALGTVEVVGAVSSQPIDVSAVGIADTDFTLDSTAATVTTETLSAAENSTAVGTLETSETATVTLGEGADSALFSLDNGVLSLNAAQDFETDETELTVNLDVVDTAGNTSTDTVTVNITDVNEAPTASTIAAQTAVVGRAFSLDVSEFFADVDANDTLSYTITGDLPDGLSLVDGVLSGTATSEVTASDLTLTATDSSGATATATLSLSVVNEPVLTTALSDMGDKMFDVRSDIVLKVNQAVSAVTGKTITFTDNTATGYQGETQTNSFTIAVDSELVTIDNENGVIIISVDDNFDLDLSSSYTMSIDTGAFASTQTGLPTGAFADVTFNTVTPTSGEDNLSGLGQVDLNASIENYLPVWFETSTTGSTLKGLFEAGAIALSAVILSASSDYEALDDKSPYEVLTTAAQSWSMNTSTGELEASSEWVDIEGLGNGTASQNVASLDSDVAAGNVFKIDASQGDYVFVFSDQNPNGGDPNVGAGLETNTDFSVFMDEFGAGDQIYIDDAFNDADNLNILAFEVFASGQGGDGSELYLGLTGDGGDPRLYVGLEGDTVSTDEDGNADNSLEGVNDSLGLTGDDSIVITA